MPALLFSLGFATVIFMIYFIIVTLADPYKDSLLKLLAGFFILFLVGLGIWNLAQVPW